MSSDGADAVKGKGNATQGLVPDLRFPEFRNAEGWRRYYLQQLEERGWMKLGRGDVISNTDINSTPGQYPIYSSSVKNDGLFGRYGRYMFDEELISWSVDGGGNFFHRPHHKFSVTNVSGYMRLDTAHLNYRFVASQLQAQHAAHVFDYQFKAHPSVIRTLYCLGVPELVEQIKIADCLTSLDHLITAEGERLAALRDHKKGLMQELFPAQGQTTPRLRFRECQDAGDWDEVTMQNALAAPATYGIVKAGDFQTTGIRMVRGGDIKGGVINTELPLVSAEIHQEYRRTIIRTNDVLIALVGYPGEAAVVPEELAGSNVSRAVGLLRPMTTLNPYFLANYLNSDKGRREVLAPSAGSAQLVVNLGALNGLKLVLPQAAEQKRIADALAALDAQLRAQADRIDALKAHKSGLMQQLFPSSDGTPQ